MPTQRRSKDVTESTRETRKDRAGARTTSQSDTAESQSRTTSKDKESDSPSSSDTGRVTRRDTKEITSESTTKAAAIIKPKAKVVEPVRKFAQCPRCHEKRYKPEQYGTKVRCTNCRINVVLR